jgi:16S rRNA U516 pseudouridylate synthase RsuA-like enzyme
MADDRTLDLKSIIAKFNQSSTTLDALSGKLATLSSVTQESSKAQIGITEAHNQVRRVADEVGNVVQELRRASIVVESALESVATFLNGTNLGAMQVSINRISEGIEEHIRVLNQKLEDLTNSERALIEEVSALRAKVGSVPEKIQKKLGWI